MKRQVNVKLGIGIVVAIAILFGLLATPPSVQIAAIGFFTLLMISALMPLRALVLLWAALLPIWSIGTLDPLIFDVARVLLAVVIGMRSSKLAGGLWTKTVMRFTFALGFVGATLLIVAWTRDDQATMTTGVTILISVASAWLVLRRTSDPWLIFDGYMAGAAASATVLMLSALSIVNLSPQVDAGILRQTGLSPSATLVTYQLALAVVFAWAGFARRKHRVMHLLVGLLCLAALAFSGGRGGVLALALALIIALRWGWVRIFPMIALGVIAWGGIVLAERSGLTVNTLQRLLDSSQSGQPDLRAAITDAAIAEVIAEPVTGPGLAYFHETVGSLPHFALLTFFIAGGILCGTIIIAVTTVIAGRLIFVSPRLSGPAGKAAHLGGAVLLVSVFLEPWGPFVGIEFTTILLLTIAVTSSASNAAAERTKTPTLPRESGGSFASRSQSVSRQTPRWG